MRKRDLFLAGLLFMAVPAFAQDEPTFTSQDAKVIFTQDFEADWDTWQSTPVDTIYQLEYYNIASGGNKTFSNAWSDATLKESNLIVRTDSVSDGHEGGIILYNGVMLTDDAADISSKKYGNDTYSIVDDNSQERIDAFAQWGEDGGQKMFQFVSADRAGTDYSSSSTTLYTDAYRRNLFVRLNPGDIEPETSYRLTFYVKAKETNPKFSPRLHAAIFRGYFHSEKPFTMGLQNDNDNYKYNTQIEYTKEDFTNDWEKVTYMTYYLNDSIADYFMLSNGYWWSNDWVWKAENNPTDKDLVYIKQPDKFFVRLSFQSDSTKFELDNLSLTKSWIGGCEYAGDKMRVDFGYKTNLSDIVAANKKLTNLPAVGVECEVPDEKKAELGYDWRIQVWGLRKDNDKWEEVYMRSAEYHDDGYMYLFTEFYDDEHAYQFDDYKKVLVTFHNPTDIADLTLKYTGTGKDVANLFPKALDTTWIKNGKIVPDFYNEIATPNPYVFTGVHSLADLPPVMQRAPYEEGSFGLEPTQTLSFKFSRDILVDDAGEASEKAIGYVNGVVWTPSFNETDSILTFTCPDDSWKTMSGDYEIKLIQLYGKGTDMGANVVMHYHFGAFERNPEIVDIKTDWRSNVTGTSRPIPTGTYMHSGYTDNGATPELFVKGNGLNSPGKCGLYNMNGDGIYNAGLYLSNRNSGTGSFYTFQTLAAGRYTIDFRGLGWGSSSRKLVLKMYPAPDVELVDGDAESFAALEAVEGKVEIGRITKWDANISSAGDWVDGYTDVHWSFSVPADGTYVFEFYTDGSTDYKGVIFSNYNIKSDGNLSYAYTLPLNDAVEAAKKRLALADVDTDLYGGAMYDAFNAKIAYYEVGGAFDALHETEPTVWQAAKEDLIDATNTMKLRMDRVDKFVDTRNKVVAKLAETETDYSVLDVWQTLNSINETAQAYPVTTKTGADIYAFNKEMEDAIKVVDDRVASIGKFTDLVKSIETLINAADAQTGLDEYATMVTAYNTYKDTPITSPEDVFSAAFNGLTSGKNAYVFRTDYTYAKTRQVKELYALADKLGYDFTDMGGQAEVKAKIDALQDDDAELSAILREAVILQIYEAYADGMVDELDSLDVSALLPNYFLYVDAVDDAMENNEGTWRIKNISGGNKVAIPGWSISYGKGNWLPTTVKVGSGDGTMDWSVYGHTFAGGLRCAPHTQGVIVNDSIEMPDALYWVGLYGYNQTSNVKMVLTSDSCKVGDTDQSSLNKVWNPANGKFGYKEVGIDSINIAGKMTITINQTSDSGSEFDIRNFILRLRGTNPDVNYDDLYNAQETKLDGLLTVVDANKAVKEGVEYYTVGGMKLDAPKSGQILIRRTTQNGKVVVDKVLIK